MKYILPLLAIALIFSGACSKNQGSTPAPVILRINEEGLKVLPPANGVYHGIFPDFVDGINPEAGVKVTEAEQLLRKGLGFVTLQNDFVDGFAFPSEMVREILAQGKVPLIRMMPRSRRVQFQGPDPIYTMEKFLAGDFDEKLREWARGAMEINGPMMVEFGPEVNGMWYSWSGRWNGWNHTVYYGDPALPDGPERFRDVYRRVVTLMKEEGVKNITWVFHIDSQPIPNEAWNGMANYYPGDAYIDWIGVSVFGAQKPSDWYGSFTEILDEKWGEIQGLSPDRPMVISEWGVIEKPGVPDGKARWITDALGSLMAGRYPRVRAVNYWHERSWAPADLHNFRLDSSPEALSAYHRLISSEFFLPKMQTVDFQ